MIKSCNNCVQFRQDLKLKGETCHPADGCPGLNPEDFKVPFRCESYEVALLLCPFCRTEHVGVAPEDCEICGSSMTTHEGKEAK